MSGRYPFREFTKDFPEGRRWGMDGKNKQLLAEMPRAGDANANVLQEGKADDELAGVRGRLRP